MRVFACASKSSCGWCGCVSQVSVTALWKFLSCSSVGLRWYLAPPAGIIGGVPRLTASVVQASLWLEFSPALWSVEVFCMEFRHARLQMV